MQIDRTAGKSPRTQEIIVQVSGLRANCVGCADCKGLCHELIEAMLVPELVLKGK